MKPPFGKTRLTLTNYETQAASASDMGGMEVSRDRLVITIGLQTITCNPQCVAIILAAKDARKQAIRYLASILHEKGYYVFRQEGDTAGTGAWAPTSEAAATMSAFGLAARDLPVRTKKVDLAGVDSPRGGRRIAAAAVRVKASCRLDRVAVVEDNWGIAPKIPPGLPSFPGLPR